MATASDIIERAYRSAKILGEGESMTADMQADGLVYLNDLLEDWSNDSLMIYQNVEEDITMTGAQSYTWGTGGDIATARPLEITGAYFQISGTNIDIPVGVLTKDEYDAIGDKVSTSDAVDWVYLYTDFPLAKLYVFPVASAGTLTLTTQKPLTAFTAVTDSVSLPPGYNRALRLNLADELQSEFGISNQDLTRRAMDSKKAIQRINDKPRVSSFSLPVYGSARSRIERGY